MIGIPSEAERERRRDPLTRLFLLIKEPRVGRIFQLLVYLGHAVAGYCVIQADRSSLQQVLGQDLRLLFGCLLIVAAAAGAVAVLPGIWWLERVGVFGLVMALGMYLVVLAAVGTGSGMGTVVVVILIIQKMKRWTEIRRFQVAP